MKNCDVILASYRPLWERSALSANAVSEEGTVFPRFDEDVLRPLCESAITVLQNQSSVIHVPTNTIVVGDLHGNATQLLRILHIFGLPPKLHYLFLGDYVDRGAHSVEVMTLLISLMVKYPEHVFLIRGNHECADINSQYGFYDEITCQFGEDELWQLMNDMFCYLPLAAIIDKKIFCVHGGLSPQCQSIESIKAVKLPIESSNFSSMITDLLWSDPYDTIKGFTPNQRGCGVVYGPDTVSNFLQKNNLKFLIRAHQCIPQGYSFFAKELGVTLFSSSDYCPMIQNYCGVIKINENKLGFFTLQRQSDSSVKPKVTKTLAGGEEIGFALIPRVATRPNMLPRTTNLSSHPPVPKIQRKSTRISSNSPILNLPSMPKTTLRRSNSSSKYDL